MMNTSGVCNQNDSGDRSDLLCMYNCNIFELLFNFLFLYGHFYSPVIHIMPDQSVFFKKNISSLQ